VGKGTWGYVGTGKIIVSLEKFVGEISQSCHSGQGLKVYEAVYVVIPDKGRKSTRLPTSSFRRMRLCENS